MKINLVGCLQRSAIQSWVYQDANMVPRLKLYVYDARAGNVRNNKLSHPLILFLLMSRLSCDNQGHCETKFASVEG